MPDAQEEPGAHVMARIQVLLPEKLAYVVGMSAYW